MTVRMWEVVAAPGSVEELVAWVRSAVPEAEVYVSDDDRVVAIDPTGAGPGDPPAHLVVRPPHAWDFRRVQ